MVNLIFALFKRAITMDKISVNKSLYKLILVVVFLIGMMLGAYLFSLFFKYYLAPDPRIDISQISSDEIGSISFVF